MICIALTGGIACGKSLFGRFLSDLGAETADADDVVRALHAPGGKAAQAVLETFGGEYVLPDGSTDRKKLAALVFVDPAARRRLEAAVHPLVRAELLAWRDAEPRPAVRVAQIPLLFESGWRGDWDLAVTVETASLETRVARIAARGVSREEALARIAAQKTSAEREALADVVVRNDGGPGELREAAVRLYRELLERKPT